MRLRPGPMTEASAVFGVGWIVALIIYMAALRDINYGFQGALTAVPLMFMPSWAIWALAGRAVKRKSTVAKFVTSLSVSSVVALAVILLLLDALAHAPAGSAKSGIESEAYIFVAGYYIGSIAGAVATYFWLTKEKR